MRTARRRAPGPIFKEGKRIRTAGFAFVALLTLGLCGCGSQGPIQKEPPAPPEERGLHTVQGQTVRRSAKGDREILWAVSWHTADFDYLTDTKYGGAMRDVSGTIYDRGHPVDSFRADTARAVKGSDSLVLSGHVVLTGAYTKPDEPENARKATLTCSELEWDADARIVKAKTNVNLDTSDYRVGPFPELWCTPELDLIGTPEMFRDLAAGRSKNADGANDR